MTVIEGLSGTADRVAQRPRRVIVFGRPADTRREVLSVGAEVWRGIDGIEDVAFARSLPELLWLGLLGGPSIVIPLRERQLKRAPRWFQGLVPSRRALAICHDKARFARFATAAGLGELVPRSYAAGEELRFPLVLKRRTLANGTGVAIARSAAELDVLRQQWPWAGRQLVLQEYVGGSRDLVTHCVARRGRIVWQATYEYLIHPERGVQRPETVIGRRRVGLSPRDEIELGRFVKALDYDGPATFDYRRRPDGRPVVLEINARLGGSLFRPENIDDLRGALQAIIAHAAPPGIGRRR